MDFVAQTKISTSAVIAVLLKLINRIPFGLTRCKPRLSLSFQIRRNAWLAVLVAPILLTACNESSPQHGDHQPKSEALAAKIVGEDVVSFLNEDLFDQLRPQAPLRLLENLNRAVQKYYTELPVKHPSPDFEANKAKFYLNHASVLRELGRVDEAKENARSALELLEPFVQHESNKLLWVALLACAHAEMRNIISPSEPSAALHHAREAIRYCNRAHDLDSTSDNAVLQLSDAHLELCSVMEQQNNLSEATREIGLATQLLTTRPSTETNSVSGQAQWALRFYYQGIVQHGLGSLDLAQVSLSEYLLRIRQLTGPETFADQRFLHYLSIAHGRLGQVLLDRDDTIEALKHLKEYRRLADGLDRFDPENSYYRRELGFSLDWLATALERNEESVDIITDLLVQAHQCFEKLENDFPQNDLWAEHTTRALVRLADWHDRHHRPELARDLLADEVTRRWSFLLQFSGHRVRHRGFIRVLECSENEGGSPSRVLLDAPARLRNWLTKVTTEAAKPWASREWDWTKASVHRRLALALAGKKEFEDAQHELELSLPLWIHLANDQSKDSESSIEVARTFGAINRVSRRAGLKGQKMKAIQSFVNWLKTRNPTSPGIQQILQITVALQTELMKLEDSPTSEEQIMLEELNQAIQTLRSSGTGMAP